MASLDGILEGRPVVANPCGWLDPAYFARCFPKACGESARALRRRLKAT